jgi:iron complex transport system ATP-binding protein
MEILDVCHVSFSYTGDDFITDLSLTIPDAEFIGLLGANGSGKSTILKLASGILRPHAGEISLWEKPIQDYRGSDRAKLISYLPQILDINVPFRVKELVSMGLYPYHIMPELSPEEAMALVGLGEKRDSLITELSGGERRRVFIAMTLVQGAGIVLLDEPLANLDIRYQIEFVRLLKVLRDDKRISIVMALHDINMAFHFDRVYVIKEGKLLSWGDPHKTITEDLLRQAFDVEVEIYRQSNGTVSFGYK